MKFLIVEDDTYKLEDIIGEIEFFSKDADITSSRSVQSAVISITENDFNAVILDMSLPSHDRNIDGALGIPRLSGGLEVLMELQYLKKNPLVVIVTQYPEIEISGKLVPLKLVPNFVRDNFEIEVNDCIYFDPETTEWRSQIRRNFVKL